MLTIGSLGEGYIEFCVPFLQSFHRFEVMSKNKVETRVGLLRALSVAVIEIIPYSPELFSKLVLLSLASAEH